MANVNLDALIAREDFEAEREQESAPIKESINVRDLAPGEFFFQALRKPDFQRETDDWDPKRVVELIGTFLEGDLIPSVVLWRNRDLYFVIDGAHRLSALIAWVHDDYGDKDRSQKFFDFDVPDEQMEVADRTRKMVRDAYGTYAQHQAAAANPIAEHISPAIKTRALRLGASLALELQWVRGESSAKAEQSFKRINQRSALISSEEFHLLETRRRPMTTAARAILRRGKGRQYWPDKQEEVARIASEINDMLFKPSLVSPIKTADLPVCGSPYASNVLVTIHDFVTLCVGDDPEGAMDRDDADGAPTLECLRRTRRVLQRMCSNAPSSLGLHPAIYFYSWTGKHQPILFTTIASILIEMDKNNQIGRFVQSRKTLEDFLTNNRALVNQVVRKFGSKNPEKGKLRGFYTAAIDGICSGVPADRLADSIRKNATYSFLQPEEAPYHGSPTRYSTRAKTGIVIGNLLKSARSCPQCNGLIPIQSISIDHNKRLADGGEATVKNSQEMHPYCNTGIKEQQVHQAKVDTRTPLGSAAPSGLFTSQ